MLLFYNYYSSPSRSQRTPGLRRRSAAALLLKSWVRIPPGVWFSVCCECCVLSGLDLGDEPITRPEEFYRLWSVVVCDLDLMNEEVLAHLGLSRQKQQTDSSPMIDVCTGLPITVIKRKFGLFYVQYVTRIHFLSETRILIQGPKCRVSQKLC